MFRLNIRQLEADLGLAEDAARWAVESWALALKFDLSAAQPSPPTPPVPAPAKPTSNPAPIPTKYTPKPALTPQPDVTTISVFGV